MQSKNPPPYIEVKIFVARTIGQKPQEKAVATFHDDDDARMQRLRATWGWGIAWDGIFDEAICSMQGEMMTGRG